MESKENRSAQPRLCREAKKWGLKALLTAALPTAKGAQPTVASWPGVSGRSRTAGGDMRVPKPTEGEGGGR